MLIKMIINVLFVLVAVFTKSALGVTTYDQSQTGELNVQVDLKHVNIIAIMKGDKEEYMDYDYAYDYSEMTIKPLGGTTKPSSTTSKPNTSSEITSADIVTTHSKLNETNSTTTTIPYESSPSSMRPDISEVATLHLQTLISDPITTLASTSIASSSVDPTTSTSSSGCRKGFVLNQKGDCEFKTQENNTNALSKLVKLSQRLKLRRENKKN